MRLITLSPQFLKLDILPGENPAAANHHHVVSDINNADGIWFLCPKCYMDGGMTGKGVHSIICWTPKVSTEVNPKPGRWNLVGTNFRDISLVAGSSSILLNGGCNAHFWIRDGEIIF
ncbi:MAG: hypothetical protein LCH54_15625 [Bacteroidetes bacterium]|nr:hypothetical protein [Bacteroidota bacterium]